MFERYFEAALTRVLGAALVTQPALDADGTALRERAASAAVATAVGEHDRALRPIKRSDSARRPGSRRAADAVIGKAGRGNIRGFIDIAPVNQHGLAHQLG